MSERTSKSVENGMRDTGQACVCVRVRVRVWGGGMNNLTESENGYLLRAYSVPPLQGTCLHRITLPSQ